ncbi:MAG: serpin family protein [Nitrosopumilus sp.]|nr:serpin family protein [Nitrosopumilus sp.]MDA7955418.1 serpin family protein [Nitrosopumilus sp.]MDA7997388.1 serpin family protein [Nitrosopumilus sp.]
MRTAACAISIVLAFVAYDAHADTPRAQFESGVPLDAIKCVDGMVLLGSPRGTPACVREATATILENRGFERVYDPPVQDSSLVSDTVYANNEFAIDFYKAVSDSVAAPFENVFFSPISMYVVFAALYEGAEGEIAEQLRGVFGFKEDPKERHDSIESLISRINREDPYSTLAMANALWVNHDLQVNESYRNTVRDYYQAHVGVLDLEIEGVEKINAWIESKTNHTLSDILKPGTFDDNPFLAITNAVYFAGEWEIQFPKDNTRERDFWKSSTESTSANLMSITEQVFNHAQFDGFQMIQLPYRGDRLSMLVLLPDDIDGIGPLEKSVTASGIESWRQDLEPTMINVVIPKFKMEPRYNLDDLILKPRINKILTDGVSGIALRNGFETSVPITGALHASFIKVDEIGTEATAVAVLFGVDVGAPPPRPVFIADHPFIFAIQDDETGALLFMGRVMDPTA